MWLSGDDLDATLTLLDLAALDLRVVAAVDLDAGAINVLDVHAEDFLLGTFSLEVNAHNLAVDDFRIHDLHLVNGLGLREHVEAARLEILERGVRNEDVRVDVDAAGVEVELISDQFATSQVYQSVGQRDQHWDLGFQLLGVGLE